MVLRISEAAERLGVSASTLRRLEREGKFSAPRDWAGSRRYSEADLAHLRGILRLPSVAEEGIRARR